MPIRLRILPVFFAVLLAGCTEASLVGSAIYAPKLVLVQQTPVDPQTNALGTPIEPPKIVVSVRNDGDGTAYNPHIELRLKQSGTIIEAARGTFPSLAPGERAVETIWLHDVDSHDAYNTVDCRLHWMNARNRSDSRSC